MIIKKNNKCSSYKLKVSFTQTKTRTYINFFTWIQLMRRRIAGMRLRTEREKHFGIAGLSVSQTSLRSSKVEFPPHSGCP